MESIQLQYPLWYLLLALIVGILYGAFLYFRSKSFNDKSLWFKPLLGLLRTMSVFFIIFLLLDPFIKSIIEEKRNPVIVVLQDISNSIKGAQGMSPSSIDALKNNYEVDTLSYATDIIEENGDTSLRNTTNIDKVLRYVEDNYAGRNLGAVILASDGIYNEGRNPAYSNYNFDAPIYTIGLGDTTIRRDISIKNIFHNQLAYLGDELPVEIDIDAQSCKSNTTSVKLFEISNGKQTLISSERINIDKEQYFKTIEKSIKLKSPGINHYRISVNAVNGEISLGNNTKDFYVEVLDERLKILVLAQAPHPDIAVIKRILEKNKNYEITTKTSGNKDIVLSDYDLVIFHNLPSQKTDLAQYKDILTRKKIPRLYILGSTTDLNIFNSTQDVVNIRTQGSNNNEVQAKVNGDFKAFKLNEGSAQRIGQFPPLNSIFGEFIPGSNSSALLNQKIGDVNTDYPLLSFRESLGIRTAVISGEGLWKWSLYEGLQYDNTDALQDLLLKTIQYLSLKDNKKKFRTRTNKKLYNENEVIAFESQLFNDSYQLINDPEVQLVLTNVGGDEYNYTLNRTQDYYSINIDGVKEGKYNFNAKTVYNGKSYEANGSFNVKSINLEEYNLTADHALLQQISAASNGKFYHPDKQNLLLDELIVNNQLKPSLYQSNTTKSVLNFWWILASIIFLLILEWFLRRYFGSY